MNTLKAPKIATATLDAQPDPTQVAAQFAEAIRFCQPGVRYFDFIDMEDVFHLMTREHGDFKTHKPSPKDLSVCREICCTLRHHFPALWIYTQTNDEWVCVTVEKQPNLTAPKPADFWENLLVYLVEKIEAAGITFVKTPKVEGANQIWPTLWLPLEPAAESRVLTIITKALENEPGYQVGDHRICAGPFDFADLHLYPKPNVTKPPFQNA